MNRILNAMDRLPLQHREAEDELEQLRARKPQPFERREELMRLQQRAAEIQAIIDAWNKEGERKQVFDEHVDVGEDEEVDLDAEEQRTLSFKFPWLLLITVILPRWSPWM